MRQLPGLASQHLMAQGYGYRRRRGDWKVAAMTSILKAMSEGMTGGTAFMEDYTYHLVKGPGIQPRRAHAGGLPLRCGGAPAH